MKLFSHLFALTSGEMVLPPALSRKLMAMAEPAQSVASRSETDRVVDGGNQTIRVVVEGQIRGSDLALVLKRRENRNWRHNGGSTY